MMPVMAFLMVLVLMLQLQSFSKLALVMLTAPLGLIGVSLFLLLFNQPFGFVSLLGVIALAGMIMRNSVILVDQIDQDIRAGHSNWDAVIDATVRRARPILLTAGTAIFAMIPLSRSVFWGPMAVALMGGLLVATAPHLALPAGPLRSLVQGEEAVCNGDGSGTAYAGNARDRGRVAPGIRRYDPLPYGDRSPGWR